MTNRDALLIKLAEDLQQELHGSEECIEDALVNAVHELLGQLAHATAFSGPFCDGSFAAAYEARFAQLAGSLRAGFREGGAIDEEDAVLDLASCIEDDDGFYGVVHRLAEAHAGERADASRAYLLRRLAGAFGVPRGTTPAEVAEDAGLAFWRVVADTFPNAASRELDARLCTAMDATAEAAVASWIQLNVPKD